MQNPIEFLGAEPAVIMLRVAPTNKQWFLLPNISAEQHKVISNTRHVNDFFLFFTILFSKINIQLHTLQEHCCISTSKCPHLTVWGWICGHFCGVKITDRLMNHEMTERLRNRWYNYSATAKYVEMVQTFQDRTRM